MKQDQFRGSLLAGAAGDALGYAVEFIKEDAIFSRYGEDGITEFDLKKGVAEISDDTQMTLFTAEALLMEGDPIKNIALAYREWLLTQNYTYKECRKKFQTQTRLMAIPELFSPRAPGITCISAIYDGMGSVKKPVNKSKGCGGVMRVAPIGLMFDPEKMPQEESDMLAAEAAALTHGHPLGYIPAAAFAHIVSRIVWAGDSIKEACLSANSAMAKLFAKEKDLPYFLSLMEKAIGLAESDELNLDAIHALGEGWVAEEALAIAVFAAIRYADDIESALIVAANHKGDSDSTAAIAGNIIGASLGMSAIPEKFLEKLELKGLILRMADDLYAGSSIFGGQDGK